MRSVWIVIAILALSSISCGDAAKKRKKFEGDFEFADDAVGISSSLLEIFCLLKSLTRFFAVFVQ